MCLHKKLPQGTRKKIGNFKREKTEKKREYGVTSETCLLSRVKWSMRTTRKTQHQTSKQASTNKNICCIQDVKKYLYRRPTRLPATRCPALHPRRSRRSEHRERRECRRHRHPIPRRVGRGRVINYASNSIEYREARLYRTQGYHLKATCEALRFCE